MPVTIDQLKSWCKNVLAGDPQQPKPTLKQYLAAIPKLGSLADVPKGTPVLVRGDVDAKPGEKIGKGDIRLRSMKETLEFGRERGWKQIIFGHIGRDPAGSLDKVAKRLGEILGCKVDLIDDWMNDETGTVSNELQRLVTNASPGAVLMLQNTRKYKLETVLWKKKPSDIENMDAEFQKLATLCNELASKVAKVYVNEALSAGSMDTSSVVVPAAMEKVALGKYCASEFEGPMMDCMAAKLVVFSGIKIDKLDDLEAMIERGQIKTVISAGSIAMALKKADVELRGGQFSLGAAENPANAKLPFYIPPERVEQAKRIISQGQAQGVAFHLPVDFMLENGAIVDALGPNDAQFDIGPTTSQLFEAAIADFIEKNQPGDPDNNIVVFHNGVFGKFEEEKFAEGTRRFVKQLAVLKDAGAKVYVGGGEGGKAVTQYLGDDKITHMFTAGGTVLNALGSEPVPYLVALKMAAKT
jgi:phosphoglycerate kinase